MTTPVLEEAHALIYGDREQTYGAPDKNLNTIAGFWEEYLHARGLLNTEAGGLNRDDVCYMMSLLKIARLANDQKHRDSRVDTCGYIALADRCDHAR